MDANILGTQDLIIFLIQLISMMAGWKIFVKAGIEGWKSLIPFYSAYVAITEVAKLPGWYFFIMFIPIVNFYFFIVILNKIAKSFGKGIPFTVGLVLLFPIFIMILGFDESKYSPIY